MRTVLILMDTLNRRFLKSYDEIVKMMFSALEREWGLVNIFLYLV